MTRALILRVIPYGDNSKMVQCLTEQDGLKSCFLRTSKRNPKGAVQVGAFLNITLQNGRSAKPAIQEVMIDDITMQHPISPMHYGIWLFTMELISKSAQDSFHIPNLLPAITKYYCLLAEGQVSAEPATPVIMLAHIYGILDTQNLGHRLKDEVINDLHQLGVHCVKTTHLDFGFEQYLQAFQRHFSISSVNALSLV